MKKFVRVLLALIGPVLIHIGVVFITQARVGSDPLTLFMETCVLNFGLTLGTWNALIGVVFVIIAFLCDKKKIGFSTVYYILTSNLVIDNLMTVILPAQNLTYGIVYALLGVLSMSLGGALSVCARYGLSYYDAFLYSVTDRFNINYVVFRYSCEAAFTLASILLHHYPSFGTVFFLLAIGPSISTILKIIKGPIRRYLGMQEDY